MFLESKGKWTLLVHRASGPMVEVDRWLRRYGPMETTVVKGPAPRVLRAEFARVPAGWSEILRAVKIRFLQLAPSGVASLFYEDDELGIRILVHDLRRDAIDVHDRPTESRRDTSSLTVPQYEVLSLAVGLGYYESPPRVDQRDIAVHLGISIVRVSELLDAGEATVVTAHIDSIMKTTMCDASFDARSELDAARLEHEGR